MFKFSLVLRCSLWLTPFFAASVWAETVSVAVASNFIAPMQQIAAQFAQDTGHKAELSFGATGKFYAQINHGAPFDILLSADESTPQKLATQGQADAASRFTYAIGQLALWSQDEHMIDGSSQVLTANNWNHIAVANPKLAPYGAAALQTLNKLGLTNSVTPKMVQGENIGQTYQFVASGNAPLGFVALSQIMQNGRITSGSAWLVPSCMHAPIRQDAIMLRKAQTNPAAQAFMDYLKSEKARTIITSYGYGL